MMDFNNENIFRSMWLLFMIHVSVVASNTCLPFAIDGNTVSVAGQC